MFGRVGKNEREREREQFGGDQKAPTAKVQHRTVEGCCDERANGCEKRTHQAVFVLFKRARYRVAVESTKKVN